MARNVFLHIMLISIGLSGIIFESNLLVLPVLVIYLYLIIARFQFFLHKYDILNFTSMLMALHLLVFLIEQYYYLSSNNFYYYYLLFCFIDTIIFFFLKRSILLFYYPYIKLCVSDN